MSEIPFYISLIVQGSKTHFIGLSPICLSSRILLLLFLNFLLLLHLPLLTNCFLPLLGKLKLNIDATIKSSVNYIGVGVVIRDALKGIIAAIAKVLPSYFSTEVGEWFTLRERLLLTYNLDLLLSSAETDVGEMVIDFIIVIL